MQKLSLITATLVSGLLFTQLAFGQKPSSKGNGSPNDAKKLYSLNIIGLVAKDGRKVHKKDLDSIDRQLKKNGNSGRRIFVIAGGNTKIKLSEGDFQVLDHYGLDGQASFQLPAPATESGEQISLGYSVHARILGKVGGQIELTTCAENDYETLCSEESLVMERDKGGSKFEDVSSELLTVSIDGTNYPLFSQEILDLFETGEEGGAAEYFWDVDTNLQFKLLRVEFYDKPALSN